MSIRRKVQRNQPRLLASEYELRCDLLEAWLRRHGERSPCPPPQLMGWMANIVTEGPAIAPEFRARWPELSQVVLSIEKSIVTLHDTPAAKVDCTVAASHMLSYSVGSALWASSGYPTVRCGDELAAALMLTDSGSAVLEDHLPWPAFVIHVPPGTLHYRYEGKAPTPVESLLVSQAGNVYMVTLVGAEPSIPFSVAWGTTLEALLSSRDSWTQHAVVAEMAVNLVRGVLLQIQAGRLERVPPKKAAAGRRWRSPGALPATQDFVLGTAVRGGRDYLGAARKIAAGDQRFGKVQWLVRGHQRWQACGPRHAQRKLIWIEPFWKGPVDAPMLVREHVLEAAEVET